jgi:chemotaxis protein methyltransferase CheR
MVETESSWSAGTAPREALPGALVLRAEEFALFQRLLHQVAGIWVVPAKRAMVEGRLARRTRQLGLDSFGAYFRRLAENADERQTAIDLLTTNETHFFREPRHFDFLRTRVAALRGSGRPVRVWSAAASTGQEPYTIAMVLAQALGDSPWEIFASDLSRRVLERAASALYDISLAREIPQEYLHEYCLKGVGAQEGRFAVAPQLVRRVRFAQVNLNEPLPDVGQFDVIFLRNVMIYFQTETKRAVVARILRQLRPEGYLLVGHSESLHGLAPGLQMVVPSVYRKAP